MRSTAPCASVPECAAKNAAAAPRSKQVAAAGPVKGARPVREIHRKITPRMRSAIAKWTMMGWYAPMFGMGEKITAWAVGCGMWVHSPHPTSHDFCSYRGLIASRTMSSTANLTNSARLSRRRWLSARTSASRRSMSAISRAQLVLEIEVLRDESLDLRTDCRTAGFGGGAVCALLRARVCLESKHLADKLRSHAVALTELLHHVELDGELRDLHPVLVLRRWPRDGLLERTQDAVHHVDRLIVR